MYGRSLPRAVLLLLGIQLTGKGQGAGERGGGLPQHPLTAHPVKGANCLGKSQSFPLESEPQWQPLWGGLY